MFVSSNVITIWLRAGIVLALLALVTVPMAIR